MTAVVTALPDKGQSQAIESSEQDLFPASAVLEPVLDQEQGSILYAISHTMQQGASRVTNCLYMSILHKVTLCDSLLQL